MTLVALVLAIFIAVLGVLGLLAPARLLGFVQQFQTPSGLAVAAGIRLLLGVALWLAAPESRAPDALRILGALTFVAGVATPYIGIERVRRLIAWWSEGSPWTVRAWAVVAIALGLGLIYALTP